MGLPPPGWYVVITVWPAASVVVITAPAVASERIMLLPNWSVVVTTGPVMEGVAEGGGVLGVEITGAEDGGALVAGGALLGGGTLLGVLTGVEENGGGGGVVEAGRCQSCSTGFN